MSATAVSCQKPDTTWLSRAKYGVFIHFLPSGDGFQREINKFDANAFAQSCREAGAGYVIWTVGQNSGYFCTPNSIYDQHSGRPAGKTCSVRDLPLDLAAALGEQGLSLMLYAPNPPAHDTRAALRMGAKEAVYNFNGENWILNDTLVKRWAEVLEEWSQRYGSQVAGWWLDGCYRESGFTDTHASIYNQAVKAGNADALVAFNSGLNFDVVSEFEDFLAGESNEFFNGKCSSRLVSSVQWHELSYLGSGWGRGTPRCSGPQLVEYLGTHINPHGGVLTIDVPLAGSQIDSAHLRVLSSARSA